MKTYMLVLYFLLLGIGITSIFGQNVSTDENGRLLGTTAGNVLPAEQTVPANFKSDQDKDDADIPGSHDRLTFSPSELQQLADKMNGMEERLLELQVENERLRQENQSVLQSVASCCSAETFNKVEATAFLLQNSPNPFQSDTQIQFFIPKGAENARLVISDLKGEVLQSHSLMNKGFGNVTLEGLTLESGTYTYSLWIGKEMVDAKLMIITK